MPQRTRVAVQDLPRQSEATVNDATVARCMVKKGQWIVRVQTWLERDATDPLVFRPSAEAQGARHATHTGLKSCVLGIVGKLGEDVLEDDGVYRVTREFDAKIRQRNLYRFT